MVEPDMTMLGNMVEPDMTDNVEEYGRARYDNVEEYGRARFDTDDNIIWCLHFDCWITKDTDTHSEYVTPIASPL